ncbi:DEAD/DEAH box helicase family protein, partial [Candidatus Dependentiae bacterium]|nr:DEAD/DEAH box helicase family protein [Candidatus Dependentiae bacterium]
MTGQELKYLDVVFNLSLNKSLEYKISGPLAKKAKPGARVIVPLGFKKELGIIIKIKDKNDFENPKEIYDLIDYEPIIPKELLKLTIWLGNYYISPPGKAVFLALPPGYKKLPALQYYVNPDADENIIKSLSKAPLQKKIFEDISERKSTSKIYLKRKFKHHSISTALKGLINKNLVLVKTKEMKKTFKPPVKLFVNLNSESSPDEKLLKRKTVQRVIEYIKEINTFVDSGVLIKETKITRQLVNQLVKEKVLVQIEVDDFKEPFIDPEFITIPDFKLNKIQSKHLKKLLKAIDEEKFKTFLLFGVTGSGKTEIYIKAIEEALSRGKTAICLVPEITLTPQVAGLFRARFGKRVGIFHSRLTMLERMSIYSQV